MAALYWTRAPSPWGALHLLATEHGLCRLVLPGESGLEKWVARYQPGTEAVEGCLLLEEASRQLGRYFAGKPHSFDLPLDLYGTPFQKTVWQVLQSIPAGETRTYAQVAAAAGRPQAARATGTAIGDNPLPIVIPCHRVIRTDGSLGGFGGGLPMKVALLRLEGCARPSFVLE